MKLQPIGLAIGSALLIAGCANVPQPTTVKPVSAEDVLRQVKKELAQYAMYHTARAQEPRAQTICKGNIDFVVDSVSISLLTQTELSVDGSFSFSVPVASAGTLGPSASASATNRQNQTINFTIYPVNDTANPPGGETKSASLFVGTPIADGLKAFRDSLVKASDQPPCVTFARVGVDRMLENGDDRKQENSIAYGFTIIETVKGGASYRFLVFSAGLNSQAQQQNTNTITVRFKAVSTKPTADNLLPPIPTTVAPRGNVPGDN